MSTFCTYPATLAVPTFQAIYVCITCTQKRKEDCKNGEDELPLCICYNCAEECHKDHEVDYYGQGPCYCDCKSFFDENDGGCASCALYPASVEAALKLGISQEISENNESIVHSLPQNERVEHGFPFFFDVFTLPFLLPNDSYAPCDALIHQALELIKHSTDTHWIPHNEDNFDEMSQLEVLAYSIFRRHVDEYDLRDKLGHESGLEWWIQVKKDNKDAAIDLHYDKDEELAETFDLGSFPSLSTVTYLTGNLIRDGDSTVSASPTLVFPHTYEMPGEGPIGGYGSTEEFPDSSSETNLPGSSVVLSHVREGKHLVFDGDLLHGSPSHIKLRQEEKRTGRIENAVDIRVTFLVNIWLKRKPSKVTVLHTDIRDKLRTVEKTFTSTTNQRNIMTSGIEMVHRDIGVLSMNNVDTDNARISLPFVSKGATWIPDDDSEKESDAEISEASEFGLVVSMIPPHAYENDTVVVRFDADSIPILTYEGDQSEDEDEDSAG